MTREQMSLSGYIRQISNVCAVLFMQTLLASILGSGYLQPAGGYRVSSLRQIRPG